MKKFSTTNRWLEKIEEKNVTIALNFCLLKKEKNYPAYVSKHNSNREKQVILLMIQTQKTEIKSEGRWHYLAVKCFLPLLRGITSKTNGDFYCLNYLYSFKTKCNLELHRRTCENKNVCNVIMPSEGNKISEFNQYQKSDKALFFIYVDLECIIENIYGCYICNTWCNIYNPDLEA